MAAFTWRGGDVIIEQHFTFFHLVFLVSGKSATVDHVVEGDVGDLFEAAGGHVEADGSIQEEGAELEEGVEGESRHVRLAPTIASLLHVFLKLDPSKQRSDPIGEDIIGQPGCLLPLHVAILTNIELLHLGEDRMTLMLDVLALLAQDELDPLRRGSHWGR